MKSLLESEQFTVMKSLWFLVFPILIFCQGLIFLELLAQEKKKPLCSTFSDCLEKAEKTDIHRRKVQFFTEAEAVWKKSDSEPILYKVLWQMANSIVKEALGDTGYKGETILKVTHTEAYKKEQFSKANSILNRVTKKREFFTEEEWNEIVKLQGLIPSE